MSKIFKFGERLPNIPLSEFPDDSVFVLDETLDLPDEFSNTTTRVPTKNKAKKT